MAQDMQVIVSVELAPERTPDTWISDIQWGSGCTAPQLSLDCAEQVFEGLACHRDSYPEEHTRGKDAPGLALR